MMMFFKTELMSFANDDSFCIMRHNYCCLYGRFTAVYMPHSSLLLLLYSLHSCSLQLSSTPILNWSHFLNCAPPLYYYYYYYSTLNLRHKAYAMMFHFDATLNMRHKASAMIFYFDATLDLRHKACAMMFFTCLWWCFLHTVQWWLLLLAWIVLIILSELSTFSKLSALTEELSTFFWIELNWWFWNGTWFWNDTFCLVYYSYYCGVA